MNRDDLTILEQRLGLSLPDPYREALLAGVTIGVSDPAPYFHQDVKELLILNLELRMAPCDDSFCGKSWPAQFICIGEDECGNYYSIAADDPHCAVQFFDHEADAFEEAATSLLKYFEYISDLSDRMAAVMGDRDGSSAESTHQSPPSSDVVVARTEEPRESVLDPILMSEWTSFVESDPELELRGFRTMVNPFTKEEERIGCPGLAVLDGATAAQEFQFAFGRVVVRRPGPAALQKLNQAAKALNAKVITGW